MANIYDVAKLAGVSKSSVSKVLNNAPNVSDKTRQSVEEAMATLGYQPNLNARTLAGGQGRVIALLISREISYVFSTSFFSGAIRGISNVLSQNQYSMVLSVRNDARIPGTTTQEMLSIPYADGYVLLDVRKDDDIIDLIKKIKPRRDFVLIGNWPDDKTVPFVDLDQVTAARQVFDYLYGMGHRRIAMIAGPENSQSTIDRVYGFLDGYQSEIPGRQPLVLHGSYTIDVGYRMTEEILRRQPDTTAIFASTDIYAIGCLSYLRDAGISVPGSISVVGFDDSETSAHLSPALTTVHLGEYELGCKATELLIDMIEGKEKQTRQLLLPPHLVERASVGPPCKP